ncbi:kinesin-like protein KIN-14U [Euphorbia lathyris]|uniref:kinesin-like protein KIN-14U n=1 Tax=Euphorbia lathyris TaxID=212925 RepID=UPI00331309D7
MLISSEMEEQISLQESLISSPNLDYLGGMQWESDPSIYTDVNVVPEHEKDELELSISNLQEEIAHLRQKERLLDKKRKEALNKILDIKGSIRVFCRVRPFLVTGRRRVHEPISIGLGKIMVKSAGIRKEFRFDKVFQQAATQEDCFVEVEPILRSALDGHNVCILAYGQTGTGKTFTMDGTNDQPGIIPRALEELYRHASFENSNSHSVTFSMSMLEVYMGNLRDLLAQKTACKSYETAAKCNLNIQTDPKGYVEIEGLTEVKIPDLAKAKWWYSKGRRARSTSWTNVNETSSRSHCLMRINICGHGEISKLWMVDLGGSERLLKTGATGQTLDEGRAINLSLSALADVIAALRRKRGHVPYRNSKLTQILKDSLGDGSKVLMLVHVSPCEEDIGETICSLSFANRARATEINGEVPAEIMKPREKRIMELEEDMREAEEESQKIRNQLQKAEFLLSGKKKLFLTTCTLDEDKENTPIILKEDNIEINETPPIAENRIRRSMTASSTSLPRFMTSTAASRLRQTAAEKEISKRATSLRSGSRNSVQFSCSQSLSYSEFRLKPNSRDSNKVSRFGDAKIITENLNCNGSDSKIAPLTRSKMVVASSDPNLKTTLARHRRRMSNLI